MNMLRFDTAEINDFLKTQTICVETPGITWGKKPQTPEKASLRECLRLTLSFRTACNTSSQKEKAGQICKSDKKVSK